MVVTQNTKILGKQGFFQNLKVFIDKKEYVLKHIN
jgi:hypothetical protein